MENKRANLIKVDTFVSARAAAKAMRFLWILSASISIAGQATHAQEHRIHISDPRLIKNPLPKILSKYTINDDGFIVDGPRNSNDSAIDYTAILTNDEILEIFSSSIFGCRDYKNQCAATDLLLTKYKKKYISYHIIYKDSEYNIDHKIHSIESLFDIANINISESNYSINDLDIIVGDVDFFAKINDKFGISPPYHKVLQTFMSEDFKKYSEDFYSYYGSYPSKCYAHPISNGEDEIVGGFIYINQTDINRCFYRSIMLSLGFVGFKNGYSSSLSSIDNQGGFSELDYILIKILYSPRLHPGMIQDDAMPIALKILEEMR